MKMITAKEAASISMENAKEDTKTRKIVESELHDAKELILRSASNGYNRTFIKRKFHPSTKEKLNDLGYSVSEKKVENTPFTETTISW